MKSDMVDIAESRTKKVLKGGYWTTEQVQAAITSAADQIQLSVQASRTEARENTAASQEEMKQYAQQLQEKTIERMTNEYSTQFSQVQNSFNFSIRELEETVTSQGEEFETFREENETYFHMSNEGMEIGRKKDGGIMPFSTMLSDTRLEFRQEGKAIAYIQYDKLHIMNVEAVRRWSVGAAEDGGYFDFISTKYGMGVKWREAQQEEAVIQMVLLSMKPEEPKEYKQLIDDEGVFEVVSE